MRYSNTGKNPITPLMVLILLALGVSLSSCLPVIPATSMMASDTLEPGALKIVNSWGTGTWQEKTGDGHYWMTYEAAKELELPIFYYLNSFENVYEPKVLAIFEISGDVKRDECLLSVGVTDSDTRELPFQDTMAGNRAFPGNAMALDISDLASEMNDKNLYLRADNREGASSGTLVDLKIEVYTDYDAPPLITIQGPQSQAIPAGQSSVYTIDTSGELTAEEMQQIQPTPRQAGTPAPQGGAFLPLTLTWASGPAPSPPPPAPRPPSPAEEDSYTGYGRGYRPLSSEELSRIRPLERASISDPSAARSARTIFPAVPDRVDHSQSIHFPPIGDQGTEGSCAAFSFAYYIHSYTEAREHNWDLSQTTWSVLLSQPSSNRDKIFSPDYVYHQINQGVDEGSNGYYAANLLIRQGGASWESMPYDVDDHDTWPSKAAFREAARYRARGEETPYGEISGYFTIKTDEDIQSLKQIIAAGYCVSTAILTTEVYDNLSSQDVFSGPAYSGVDHANTIVGYAEGPAWDPDDPDAE